PPRAIVELRSARHTAPGHSPVGVSALSLEAYLSADGPTPFVARADSGADITLLSHKFWQQLPAASRPKLRQGLKMRLYHLTGGAKMLGYVHLPLFIPSREGPLLKVIAECYVVPEMTVPLLLGEDFQLNYEFGVRRSVSDGSFLTVGDTGWSISARSTKPGPHRRKKANRRRQRHRASNPTARAAADVLIAPFTNKLVPLAFSSEAATEWSLEKTVLAQPDGSFLISTPTLFSTERPVVSVSNPTARPQYVRRGDFLGRLHPATAFDAPSPERQQHALSVQAIV
ncbi:hypothetical protein FA95DRAFT_1449781, partial [Auriscalpium vulgare]